MSGVVNARKVKLHGTLRRSTKGVMGEEEDSGVMVPMQKIKLALPQDNEDCVSQLY